MKPIICFIRNDYTINRNAFLLETIAIPLAIIAAIYLAVVTSGANFIFVYSLFLISSLILSVSCYIRGNTWVLTMNIVYCVINAIGLLSAL